MDNTEYNYLHFVKFSNLVNWSVSHLLGMNMGFTHRFPLVSIGSIIERCKTTIDIDDGTQYKQITLKTNGGGAVLRDVKLGKDIGTKKQYVVSAGQFIMSKIDARNGAFGVVTEELDGAIVTADFPVFNVNKEKIIPQYLFLLSSTVAFARFAQSCSRGTTNRQRIDIAQFLSQRIPLPSIVEQKKLLSSYFTKIHQIESLTTQAYLIGNDIESYLLNGLGISLQEKMHNGKTGEYHFLKFVRFKDITRWDVAYYSQKKNIGGKYKTYTLNDCIENFMQDEHGDSLRIETYKTPEKSFQYIGMEDVEKDSGHLIQNKCIHGRDVKSQTLRVPLHYFLYGKLRPYLNKYWFNDTGCDNIVCSSEFFVFSIKDNINKDYFRYYLSSSAVQHQIQNMYQGARMPRINEETFKAIQIPIPPINIQESIVKHIKEQKARINQLTQQAESLRKAAMAEFETAIFEP